jgi:hypothetical protein
MRIRLRCHYTGFALGCGIRVAQSLKPKVLEDPLALSFDELNRKYQDLVKRAADLRSYL